MNIKKQIFSSKFGKSNARAMTFEGTIEKMDTQFGHPVQYFLPLATGPIAMNPLIGRQLTLSFDGLINCLACGKATKKSFGQGYCYPCFVSSPETEDCVLRPELCRAHEGVARNMDYARAHCLIEHVVYLADTGAVKVGVTRHHQIPTRWIDQGASQALVLARTPNRYLAGCTEVALKTRLADKTNWRRMLAGNSPSVSLAEMASQCVGWLPDELTQYLCQGEPEQWSIDYPVITYPAKVTSIDLDKTPVFSGVLQGIKGQYLLFEAGIVINLRKYGGYYLRFSIS